MRQKNIKRLLIAGMIFCGVLSHGQTGINEDYDKKYTPNSNSIFNNLLKKNSESGRSSDVTIKNNISFWPTMIIREKIFLSYDVEVGNGICLSLGLGKAFGKDVIQNAAFAVLSLGSGELNADELLSNSAYTGGLPLISIGTKIYFSGTAFDGGYVNFAYRYEKMNYLLNPSINNTFISGSRDLSFTMNAGYFGFGYTAVSGPRNNFTHDFAIGAGIKYFSYTEYLPYQVAGSNGSTQVYMQSGAKATTKILPAINMSYAFGFGF